MTLATTAPPEPAQPESAPTESAATPVFLYDDCCPLCRGYTASFTRLGWAGREPFSTISDTTVESLDFERARHQIPLVDPATGNVRYGLDGILRIVEENAAPLGRVARNRLVRQGLDGLYWFITYNRRHIVASPPPLEGVNCAPDYEPAAVKAYLAFTAVSGVALATTSKLEPLIAGTALAATALVTNRREGWAINSVQAAGHVGTVVLGTAAAAAITRAVTNSTGAAAVAAIAVASRKLWLRRWMTTGPHPDWKQQWIEARRRDRPQSVVQGRRSTPGRMQSIS